MTQREACNATGLSYTTLYRIASAAGIKFQPDPRRGKGRREYIDPAVDAELCERLTALRDIGLNRHQVATQLQISSDRLKRLITTYSIDFPKAKTGKKVAHEKAL
ncbi:Helix-turn-helix domain protein [compost metagenome]